QQALALGRAGLDEARRLGQRHMIVTLLMNATQSAEETGDWAWAIEALDADSDDFEGTDRGSVLIEVARFLALRGEPSEEVAAEVARVYGGYHDVQSIQELEAMNALRAFAAGDLDKAFQSWLQAGHINAFAPVYFLNAARAALWAGNADRAREALTRFETAGVHGPGYHAFRRTVVAGIAALEGRQDEALPAYREALREWRDLGAAFDQALVAIDMVELLPGPSADLAGIAAAARDVLVQLQARPFIERLDAALAKMGMGAEEPADQANPAPASRSRVEESAGTGHG
ncbi:MAG: hypothetical protein ACRDGL_00390, partial [Candidatus Limnocylindrales bacterium]